METPRLRQILTTEDEILGLSGPGLKSSQCVESVEGGHTLAALTSLPTTKQFSQAESKLFQDSSVSCPVSPVNSSINSDRTVAGLSPLALYLAERKTNPLTATKQRRRALKSSGLQNHRPLRSLSQGFSCGGSFSPRNSSNTFNLPLHPMDVNNNPNSSTPTNQSNSNSDSLQTSGVSHPNESGASPVLPMTANQNVMIRQIRRTLAQLSSPARALNLPTASTEIPQTIETSQLPSNKLLQQHTSESSVFPATSNQGDSSSNLSRSNQGDSSSPQLTFQESYASLTPLTSKLAADNYVALPSPTPEMLPLPFQFSDTLAQLSPSSHNSAHSQTVMDQVNAGLMDHHSSPQPPLLKPNKSPSPAQSTSQPFNSTSCSQSPRFLHSSTPVLISDDPSFSPSGPDKHYGGLAEFLSLPETENNMKEADRSVNVNLIKNSYKTAVPSSTKEHRFKNTADALRKSGLWDVAMKTGSLMRRNRALQQELEKFRFDALTFLKSVIKNPHNRDLIRKVLSSALASSSSSTSTSSSSPCQYTTSNNNRSSSSSFMSVVLSAAAAAASSSQAKTDSMSEVSPAVGASTISTNPTNIVAASAPITPNIINNNTSPSPVKFNLPDRIIPPTSVMFNPTNNDKPSSPNRFDPMSKSTTRSVMFNPTNNDTILSPNRFDPMSKSTTFTRVGTNLPKSNTLSSQFRFRPVNNGKTLTPVTLKFPNFTSLSPTRFSSKPNETALHCGNLSDGTPSGSSSSNGDSSDNCSEAMFTPAALGSGTVAMDLN